MQVMPIIRPSDRQDALVLPLVLCLLLTATLVVSCREDKGARPRSSGLPLLQPKDIPPQLLVPGFEDRLWEEACTKYDGRTQAGYDLGRSYPAKDFIAAAGAHINSGGWSKLARSLDNCEAPSCEEQGWYPIPSGQPVDAVYGCFWRKDGQVLEIHLGRTAGSDPKKSGFVFAHVVHYDEHAAAKLFEDCGVEED
jgi:hypothetical protein